MFDHIFLTGFGHFAQYKNNPTELIAKHFQQKAHPQVTATVLQTSTQSADAYIEQTKSKIAQLRKDNPKAKVLNLHLGLDQIKVYHLERFCYNNKDFYLPDNAGYHPINQKIYQQYGLDHPIHCKMDLKQLCATLQKNFPCELSIEPGRFLCNYIYFKSSYELSTLDRDSYSLFVHTPPIEDREHEKNVLFVEKMVEVLLKKGNKNEEEKKEEEGKGHNLKKEEAAEVKKE